MAETLFLLAFFVPPAVVVLCVATLAIASIPRGAASPSRAHRRVTVAH